ncbi:helix-turn-helix domain-containing protein [Actinotalea sp. K2]|uniref:helix-turn-helix domain-containing protein n=1 Tax=Actinotalea sp. K2 TaxID=2939438 RepID=UPI002017A18A|nr:helix-turn-helix domain-containing protein [Actinotalea sp. K2]MCL3860581.1 helix-turn-helix domain-containing protein [Actinotalea sp. K2]
MTELSERLHAERTRAGLSQTALAGDDFSPSYISLIEAGRRVPTDGALKILADRLGTTSDYLRYGDKAPSEERARLEIGFAKLALANGSPEEARDRLEQLDLSTIAPRHHPEALHALARAHEAMGDLERSVEILEPLLADARTKGRWLDAAVLATDLVGSYLEAGDLHHSVELGEQVLAELEREGVSGTDEHLRLASTLLWAYHQRGDLLFAAHRAASLLRLVDTTGTPRGRGSIYWNAALIAEARQDYHEAQRLTERALAYLSEAASSRDVPRLRQVYGWLLLRTDPPRPTEALEHLGTAAEELAVVGSEVDVAKCDIERGRAYLMLGEPAAAQRAAQDALERLGESPRLDSCDAHMVLGDALLALGDDEGAKRSLQWAADMLGMMAANRQSAVVWRALGDRMLRHHDVAGAANAYERALSEVGVRRAITPVPPTPVADRSDQQQATR